MSRHPRALAPALLVIAKAPGAGRSKTRLSPPLQPTQAAALAEAALLDTLIAVAAVPVSRRVLVLDGEPGGWLPEGFELIAQRGGDLAERLADAFEDVGEPALLIGMDTPQVTPGLLTDCLMLLDPDLNDSVIGHTDDGGYWAIGLQQADRRVFSGVPMSCSRTGAVQQQRLEELGLRNATLPRLRDVDFFADAVAVAAEAPSTHFARLLEKLAREPVWAAA